ncbi:hypothetical protein F4778DRAFT_713430 [Xylariomycetidae sp. FL2044]|nr:hypothetical protein F4778DRAFT_713430 [Xylariomycetidae sp. FL2044]
MDQLGKYMGTGVNRNSPGETYNPGSVHRVDWIFEAPQFTVKGFHSSDIKQGANEDCSWLAGLATIAHRDDLMQRVCVDRNPECGVYGFVFQRDGEWISVVVDDNLFLSTADFNSGGRDVYDPSGKLARQHRKHHQTGSDALYFARCEDANETWLPILEKAYAKAHGDYEAITELWPGEAVEDLTGGVARTIRANRVLYKDRLWRDMLNQDGNFVFALAAMNPDSAAYAGEQKSGLTLDHAYSILQAREETDEHGKMLRFVKIRNPWGERDSRGIGEWNGPWSDGSREWTPYWLKKLDHQPGDDGVFWMRYEDMLDKFMWIHRTRLFDEKWTVVQKWMSANVAWVTGYLRDKFVIEVRQRGLVVIVLAQLDGAYFKGFEGQYRFELHFVLQAVDAEDGDYLCSVQPVHKWENRTVSCELELEPGRYEVVPKIMATRNKRAKPVEEVVRRFAERNPQKFKQIGMQYDLAHAKAGVPNEDEILQRKRAEARRRRREMWRMHNKQLRKRTALMEMADAMDATSGALRDAANGKESDAQRGGEKGPDDKSDDQVPQEPQKANGSDIKEKPSIQPTPGGQPNLSSTESPEPAPDSVSKEGDPQASEAADDAEPTEPSTKESETKADESIKSSENPTKDASQQTESAPQEEAAKGQDKDEQQEDEEENLPEPPFESEDDDGQDEGDSDSPWNAVCVLGLRVYAQDPEVTIDLVTSDQRKPKSTVAAVEVERAQVPSPTGEKKGEEKI